ncbi:MAG: helix-turn-helix domain-containing protein [Proteobacteria bacterium]|nr:helix-turn-helix domain-containing protein [Pseudomonadota bacterium]
MSGGFAWGVMTRGEYAALRAMADQAGQVFTLTYLGEAIQVIWRHDDAPALDAVDLIPFADPISTDPVVPTLKFTRFS